MSPRSCVRTLPRFAPVWALFFVGALLITLTGFSSTFSSNRYPDYVRFAVDTVEVFIIVTGYVNLIMGILVPQMLFGDLFNSKLCNALHALPPRRECWYITHVVAGLLFVLVPETVVVLCCMPYLGEFWYINLLWLAISMLQYLFFFGLGVVSMLSTGNRFSAILVYCVGNFGALFVSFFATTMYEPLLYGIQLDEKLFLPFCPIAWLANRDGDLGYFTLAHSNTCICSISNGNAHSWEYHSYVWGGFGPAWGYVFILAAIGLVLLGLGLWLYRKRKLESAGDFVAFKPMKPVFWVILSLCAGAFLQIFSSLFLSSDGSIGYVFLAVGLVAGFFVTQMMLARSVKIFKKRTFLQLGIFLGAFVLSLVITALDPLGLVAYVPEADQVETAYVTEGEWTAADFENNYYRGRDVIATEDPEIIEKVCQAHSQILQEGRNLNGGRSVTVCYKLKSGVTVLRQYRIPVGSQALSGLWEYMGSAKTVLNAQSLEQLKADVNKVHWNGHTFVGEKKDRILEALWKDCESGNLCQSSNYHEATHTCRSKILEDLSLEFRDPFYSNRRFIYLSIFACCLETVTCLKTI